MGVGTPVVALPHSAEAVSILAVAIVGYCGIRLFRLRREIRNLNRAEQGERRIAELLAPLRAKRYVTFNDVLVTNANIDHVLVGPTGIFAIETKTYSSVWYRCVGVDESGVLGIGGKPALKDPLGQAARGAQDVAKLLEDKIEEPLR